MSLRPRAHIHLANIADNWRTLSAANSTGTTGATIKANGYGHGLEQVASTLHDAGCDHFFVAHAFEGVAARAALGPHPVIYVLNGPAPSEQSLYENEALTPIINSQEQFETLVSWLEAGSRLRNGYVLHFDTGMNRLGLPKKDAAAIAEASASKPPSLIMSHLACSDTPDAKLNEDQLTAFQAIAQLFPNVPTSLSNSDGLWLGKAYRTALSRPGISLYGGGYPPPDIVLKPGLTLEAPILQIRTAKAGEPVGYGASITLAEDALLATVALGYGDGFPRSASNSGFAMLGDRRCPIVGRVSMDLTILDVSAAAHLARPGIFAQFIGDKASLKEQANCAGTIDYELMTGLTQRVLRSYDDL